MNPRRTPSLAWAPAVALAVVGLALHGCGSDDSGAVGATTPGSPSASVDSNGELGSVTTVATEQSAPTTTPAAPAATAVPAPATSVDTSLDACAALPSLEEISAVMGTDMSTTTPLERGPASDLCEAGGSADGGTYVQFSRTPDTTREQTEALAEELGYPVTDLGDPALAGGFTYASAAAVNIDGTEYLVQAIGLDTLGDPNSPVATARSAQLLVLWLANLGVTPIS